jgi:hypothetical protein
VGPGTQQGPLGYVVMAEGGRAREGKNVREGKLSFLTNPLSQ